MGDFNMHKIKRMAHREAWYGDSANPFRRSRTTVDDRRRDEEDQDTTEPIGRISSEPPRRTVRRSNEDTITPTTVAPESTFGAEKAETTPSRANGVGKEHSSEDTAVEDKSTAPSHSEEPTARKRKGIMGKLHRHDEDEGNEKAKSSTGLTEKSSKSKKSLKHKPFTLRNQLKATLFNSWINILLLAAPVGIGLAHAGPAIPPAAVFTVNFMAIIPLAALLSFGTEEIALRVGETLGGLLNASFGNAVEVIVSIIALVKGEVLVVKTSLIGSILSNLLLVMGMCFFFGGLRRQEQFFNVTVATTAASLLALAIASVIIPSAFEQFALTTENDTTDKSQAERTKRVAEISRGTSVILLFVYACYLYFQLKTHSAMYQQESKKVAMRPRKHHMPKGGVVKGLAAAGGVGAAQGRTHPVDMDRPPKDELMHTEAHEDAEEEDEPQLHFWVAIVTLAASTAIIAICAESMVDSITEITKPPSPICVEFVGLILLPIVGNAAEHATAVTVACKDKMDLAIGVAVGSSMQIALLVIPLSVIVGWILGKDDMNLSFDGFQVAVMFVAVLLVNYLISDGKSHWLEGVLLQCLYLIIAVTAWFYPPTNPDGTPFAAG